MCPLLFLLCLKYSSLSHTKAKNIDSFKYTQTQTQTQTIKTACDHSKETAYNGATQTGLLGIIIFIRAYLRASTEEQSANRARDSLDAFVEPYGQRVASYYVENQSGAILQRPELNRLFSDS
ncbi:recombinase family protein [Microbulbifer sp. ZKSA002]|uniref:recombinase family protein n=1 Tax=Microbulbifer sp. ZKSA002 TaxID=3243388 RepID=UPI00403948C4